MPSSYDPECQLSKTRNSLEALGAALDQARAVQWEKAPTRHNRPRVDTAERSIGAPPSDPTADVVLDDYRLAVRQAVRKTEFLLRRVEEAADRMAAELQRMVAAWEGVEDSPAEEETCPPPTPAASSI